jgi:hypothetical protein
MALQLRCAERETYMSNLDLRNREITWRTYASRRFTEKKFNGPQQQPAETPGGLHHRLNFMKGTAACPSTPGRFCCQSRIRQPSVSPAGAWQLMTGMTGSPATDW